MLKFEFLKFFRERSIIFIFTFIICILCVPIFIMNNDSFKLNKYKAELKNNENFLVEVANNPAAKKISEEVKAENILYDKVISALYKNNTEDIAKGELELEKAKLQSMKQGSLVGTPEIEQEKRIKELDFLIENNIEIVDYTTNKMPATNYIHYLFSDLIPYIYFLIIFFVIISNFTTLESRRKTISFYNVIPYNSNKKISYKLISIISLSLILFLSSLFLCFIVVSVKNGIGSWNYPVSKILDNGNIEIISLKVYILQAITYFSFLIIFFTTISLILSLFSGNILVNLLILFSSVFLSELNLIKSKFSITNLLNFPNIIIGGTTYTPLNNSSINFNFSMIVISIYITISIVFLFLILKIKKRNF